ncbi:glycoside hydrolase/phage tail family protein [Tianweitania sp. BSSL-BM11]|uniref:Glycoside hydrolase/phage tail family protein n=1 Tax=Tianweitania aestuarii TaxID=2814886 RepID=A0ABS5RUE4_9HYPH|nr:glycoside hydrolase/phage tail family protein [Tianweitania aestuarii]MBS9719896.1 glycoside hydrolase/phage tail family protein [Tianweitania aestuarii]
MATIVLQAAGAFLGGMLGPVGAVVGRAAGALAGYAVDQAVINGTRRLEGPRLNDPRPFTAEDGAALPRIYGSVRVNGTLIWATRFEEETTSERAGAKGGPKVTSYTYFANLAFALCEGPIAGVRRIWADGRELDQTRYEIRWYRGDEAQEPDHLIEARQGANNAPSYRGTAYVVFERFPLADYGNRVPQFSFEVMRPVGGLSANIRAVTLIPGSTEYGLSPSLVTLKHRPGETEALNRHVLHAGSDLVAALDELQALCPKLEHIGLVATWFGNDLRAGDCTIRPMVTQKTAGGQSQPWRVSGLDRADAAVVSRHDGRAAYGGAPSDRSVIEAIREIKARGLKVTLYPFIMMDVPEGNALPNPWGGAGQPAYPWRGRITCHPAPDQAGTAQGSAAAGVQIATFVGEAARGAFRTEKDTIRFTGPADEWSYRRFLLHFAHLAKAAGGVEAFLIGSELRGLSCVRDGSGAFPFVHALMRLAEDVRAILGADTKISYGADWSEYFGHQPAGTGDILFNLDPLWAHPAIDAIGIDNYMPLSDWRDADASGGNPDGFGSAYDPDGLRSQIAGGEGYDWYYASLDDRHQRKRTPITDGGYNKPWVYRFKDLRNWWANPHRDRVGGVEVRQATGWVPCSKPIWFTELGCSAADKGPNQPNVFPDPKSTENGLPYYSTGGRSDVAQQNFLQAHQAHWDPDVAGFREADNPLSPLYGGRMVDAERVYLWAWDARPFPAFPQRGDVWADGNNWLLGHWLNGRLNAVTVADLVSAILADHGLPAADVAGVDGSVHGFIVEEPGTARAALEPIVNLFGLGARDDGERLRFGGTSTAAAVDVTDFVLEDGGAILETSRVPDGELPTELTLAFRDPFADYQAATVRSIDPRETETRQQALAMPVVLEPASAAALAADRLRDFWAGREEVAFAVQSGAVDLQPGTVIRLPDTKPGIEYLVTSAETGAKRSLRAKQIRRVPASPWRVQKPVETVITQPVAGAPFVVFLDVPMLPGETLPENQLRIAAYAKPWKTLSVMASPEGSGFGERGIVAAPAVIGTLVAALQPGVVGRLDRANRIAVDLLAGSLASQSMGQMLNGGGTAAVQADNGAWEILQFSQAEEVAAGRWQLSNLLRAQLGTEDAMIVGASAGQAFVLLDERVKPAGLRSAELGLERQWRVGPTSYPISDGLFVTQSLIGGERSRQPLSPVHLRCSPQMDGWRFSWIRRGRLDADDWAASDIPLGETTEAYEIAIADAAGVVKRRVQMQSAALFYDRNDAVRDFGRVPAQLRVTVRQISAAVGLGMPASAAFALL